MRTSKGTYIVGISRETLIVQMADSGFTENLRRVQYLVDLAQKIYNQPDKSTRKNSKEVLRAATVLLHATLENLLRIICTYFTDQNSKEIIDKIPLIGSSNGKPEKITLGTLISFNDKSINQLIRDSIMGYYNQCVSFNSTNEIANHLERVGIDITMINTYFPNLDELINRRHAIVHHADLINSETQNILGIRSPAPISIKEVKKWLKSVNQFGLKLFDILSKHEFKRITNPTIK